MRRFQKRPDVTFAFIPGVGRLGAGQVLEGDEYAKFSPSLLVEIQALPTSPALTEPTAPKTGSKPLPSVISLPASPVPAPKPSKPSAAVATENKQTEEIEKAVERLTPVEEKKSEPPKSKQGVKKPSGRK